MTTQEPEDFGKMKSMNESPQPNRKRRRLVVLAAAASLTLFFMALAGMNLNQGNGETVDEPVKAQTPAEVYASVSEETQLVLETLARATTATLWSPEQPVASEKDSPFCESVSAEQIWYILWEGSGVENYSLILPNIQNTYANSSFKVAAVGENAVDVSSASGLIATVSWDESVDLVNIELASACFNADAGADQ